MLSIVIAYHNEGKEFIQDAINSIKNSTSFDHEIIVVDDCSDIPLELDSAKVIRHSENRGVGIAFDTGVKNASHEKIILMGSDVRFSNNSWDLLMSEEIDKHPQSLICTAVIPLSSQYKEITFELAKQNLRIDAYKGATIKLFMGDDTHDHHIIEASWLPREFLPLRSPDYIAPTECYEVPCILGACYGTTKTWYRHLDGFWGHKFWGTLEPYISIKNWMFGGRCLVAPHIETGHIFNETGIGNHSNMYNYGKFKAYNRMLVCRLLIDEPLRSELINWLPGNDFTNEAKDMIDDDVFHIYSKRLEYRDKIKFPFEEIRNKIIYENKSVVQ